MKPLKNLSDDEVAMKVFYQSCGISQEITDAAIKMRREHPVQLEKEAHKKKFDGPKKRKHKQPGGKSLSP